MRTEFEGRKPHHYPSQYALVGALNSHDIDVERIYTQDDTMALFIPITDARRLTELLKETDAHR